MSLDDSKYNVFIINFGIAKEYCDSTTQAHISLYNNCPVVGIPAFTFINVHLGIEASYHDDLKSLAYTLIHLLCSSLP